MEEAFLSALPDRLSALFMNIKEQVPELDYNTTNKLKIAMKRLAEVDMLRSYYNEFNDNHNLSKTIDEHFKDLVSRIKEQSKKIKKQKNLDKRKKLYEAEKQDRMPEIDKTNNMFAEDDEEFVKRESASARSESNNTYTKTEYD